MTHGRIEQHDKIKEKVLKRLEGMPNFLEDFFYNMEAEQKKATTEDAYISYAVNFIEFFAGTISKDIHDITEDDLKLIRTTTIDRYIINRRGGEETAIKNQSMCVILAALGSFFKFLSTHDFIDKDPFNGKVAKPKYKNDNEIVYLTPDEIKTVINNIDTGASRNKKYKRSPDWVARDKLLFLIPICTGIRVSALSNINVEDINMEEKYFVATDKGAKTAKHYFDDKIYELIKQYMVIRNKKLNGIQLDAFFISNYNQRISRKSIASIVDAYTFNIDKHITPHKLRSTCGTNLYAMTQDIYLVSKVLGHENTETTQRYTKVHQDRREQAANLIGNLF